MRILVLITVTNTKGDSPWAGQGRGAEKISPQGSLDKLCTQVSARKGRERERERERVEQSKGNRGAR